MNLLFVYQICSFGGVETVLRNRLVGLRRLGHRVRVVLLEDLGGRVFSGLDGVEIAPGEARLVELLGDPSLDVVSTVDTPSVYPLIERSGFRGSVVTEIHSNNFANLGYLDSIGASPTRALVFPSAFERDLVRREHPGLDASGLPQHVVPNPVDDDLFRFVAPAVAPDAPVIAWVGRFEEQKNWRHFLDVAGWLARRREQLGFLVVGGIAAFDAVKSEFRERVAALDLMGRLRWIPALAYERMPALYSAVAASGGCLVPTSTFEPFGMTALEAMACRCPVVTARSGGLVEIVDEERTGLAFAVDDTGEAARQIARVLDDAGLRAGLVNEAADEVADRFAAVPVARRWIEAVSGVV